MHSESRITSALHQWHTCRSRLAVAVHEYFTASVSLDSACAQALHRFSERHILEAALVDIDSQLSELVHEEKILQKTRIALTVTRNSSVTLAQMHTLPPEILPLVFAMTEEEDSSKKFPPRHPPHHLFASVSTYWRQVAIGAPHLWTQIWISTDQTSYDHALLCLDRAKNLPADILIYEAEPDGKKNSRSRKDMIRLAKFLTLASPRIRTLDIASLSYSRESVYAILKSWLDNSIAGNTDTLRVRRPNAGALNDRTPLETDLLLSSALHAEKSLLSVTVLHLQDTLLPWTSSAYHSLVDLRLEFSETSPARAFVSQFAGVLSCCPRLTKLKLANLELILSNEREITPPIQLNHLEVLYLADISHNSLRLLLPLISLSESSNNLGIGFSIRALSEIAYLLENLMRNTCTRTLFYEDVGRGGSPLWLLSLANSLPRLENIIIRGHGLLETFELDDLTAELERIPSQPINRPSSHIPGLFLVGGDVDFEDMKLMVPVYGIQELHFEQCWGYPSNGEEGPNAIQEVKNALLTLFPSLACFVSENDSTSEWPCRTMF